MNKKATVFKAIITTFLLFILAGCTAGNTEEYNDAIQNGLDKLSAEDYEKAEDYFEIALEEKPEDEKATIYLKQTQLFDEGKQSFETNDLKNAKEKLESVVDFTKGSEILVTKSKDLLAEIKRFEDTLVTFQQDYDEISQLVELENLDDALERVNAVLSNEEINKSYYSEIKENIEELKTNIENRKALAEEFAAGPADNEILPNISEGGESFSDLRNDSDTNSRVYEWKLEIEDYYGDVIEKISNQKIADYLLENYNEAAQVQEAIKAYDALGLQLQAVLAATLVDGRAVELIERDLLLNYNGEGEYIIFQITSGAGVGHPWYVIQNGAEAVTPIEGVTYLGNEGYEDAPVDSTPISKVDMLNLYLESKQEFDILILNAYIMPDLTLEAYETQRSQIGEW